MSKWLCWNRNNTWLPLLEKTPELSDDTMSTALDVYDGIVVFHGCRPANISTYQANGVQPMSQEDMNSYIHTLIKNIHPEISADIIDQAIQLTPKPTSPALLYSCIDERVLLNSGIHFTKFGSEYIQLVLGQLNQINPINFHGILSNAGRPAILELAITWGDVNGYVMGMIKTNLQATLEAIRVDEEIPHRDWCQSQSTAVPSDRILKIQWLDDNH